MPHNSEHWKIHKGTLYVEKDWHHLWEHNNQCILWSEKMNRDLEKNPAYSIKTNYHTQTLIEEIK